MISSSIQRMYPSDEINLMVLFHLIWLRKWLVLSFLLFSVLIGFLFIAFAKPQYEAKVFILPPSISDVSAFNRARLNLENLSLATVTREELFATFVDSLLSDVTKDRFFKQVFLPSLDVNESSNTSHDVLYKKLSNDVLINEVPTKKGVASQLKHYVLQVRAGSPLQAGQWVNKYILFAQENAIREVLKIRRGLDGNALIALKKKIELAKEVAQKKRKDRLDILKEALIIAQATNIENFQPFLNKQSSVFTLGINDPNLMYLRGSKELAAEIAVLSKRPSDAPFIVNLRQMEADLNFYNSMDSLNKLEPVVFRPDGKVKASNIPIAPKKTLIILLAVAVGIILSVSFVMIRWLFASEMHSII